MLSPAVRSLAKSDLKFTGFDRILLKLYKMSRVIYGVESILKKLLIASILVGGIWGNDVLKSPQTVVAQTAPTVSPAPATIPAKFELLDAGAAPRQEVKFRPLANSQQTMTMTMGMSMDMVFGETPMPKTNIPKIAMKLDLKVGKVEPSGDINYSFVYSDIKAIADKDTPPELIASIQKSLKTMMGIRGDLIVGSNGQIKSQKLILPKTLDPSLKQTLDQFTKSMEQISTQLPSQAVGLGAKWQTSNSLTVSGIQLNQTATYEVVALDARGMTVKCKVSQSAPPQNLAIPGAAANSSSKVKIDSLESTGEGSYVVRFDSLLPISGSMSSVTDSKMSVQTDPKQPVTQISGKVAIDLNMVGK
jgi:hypothetical protein